MLPLEYGGPSCSTNSGAPARAATIRSYSLISSHRARISGSRFARSPRMGNGVSGRITVSLYFDFVSWPDIRSGTIADPAPAVRPATAARTLESRAQTVRLEWRMAEEIRPRASWDEHFMSIAQVVATRSTCPRKYVGAVIVRNRTILSTGYNGSIRGMPHCSDV